MKSMLKKAGTGFLILGMLFALNENISHAGTMKWSQIRVKNRQEWVYADGATRTTGWSKINGAWYYFKESADESGGVMQVGWIQSDGKWYYLEEKGINRPLGAMYANEKTPDGYFVGADGAWRSFYAPYADVVKQHTYGTHRVYDADLYFINYMEIVNDDEEGKRSRVIYHDGYVEITDIKIIADTLFDKSLIESYKPGDRLQLKSDWYTIVKEESKELANGEKSKTLDLKRDGDPELHWLQEMPEGYLVLSGSDDVVYKNTIYKGGLYAKMDAKVYYVGNGKGIISMAEFLEMEGSYPLLYGRINIDENGFVTVLFGDIAD